MSALKQTVKTTEKWQTVLLVLPKGANIVEEILFIYYDSKTVNEVGNSRQVILLC